MSSVCNTYILNLMIKRWRSSIFLVTLTIFLAFVMVGNVFLLKELTDSVTKTEWNKFYIVAGITVIYIALGGFLRYIRQRYSAIFSIKLINDMRNIIIRRIFSAPLSNVKNKSFDSYISQINSHLPTVKINYFDVFFWGMYLFFQFLFAVIIAFIINPMMALLSLFLSSPFAIVPLLSKKSIEKAAEDVARETDSLNESISDAINGLVDWRTYDQSFNAQSLILKTISHWGGIAKKEAKVQERVDSINGTLTYALYFGAWILGGFLIMAGSMTLSEMVAFAQLLSDISIPLYSASGLFTQFQSGRKTLQFVNKNTDFIPDVYTDIKIVENPEIIEYKNFSLPYGALKYNPASFTVELDKKYLVIGESGVGKSTLFSPLLGITQEYKGDIYINGIDVSKISKDCIYRNIGYISQSSRILSGSIRNNVSMWDSSISTNILNKAYENSYIMPLVRSKGEDYFIDNSLNAISGGEKQRLLVARLFAHGYRFAIIDEVTSALDSVNSNYIEESLLKNLDGMIYISHKYDNSLINKFDYVVEVNYADGVHVVEADKYKGYE